jgi:hypothetical protein
MKCVKLLFFVFFVSVSQHLLASEKDYVTQSLERAISELENDEAKNKFSDDTKHFLNQLLQDLQTNLSGDFYAQHKSTILRLLNIFAAKYGTEVMEGVDMAALSVVTTQHFASLESNSDSMIESMAFTFVSYFLNRPSPLPVSIAHESEANAESDDESSISFDVRVYVMALLLSGFSEIEFL